MATPEWDPHGLPANVIVQLSKLSGSKNYKLSEISLVDNRHVSADDLPFDMMFLRPGGVYTKAQLLEELETVAACGMFERVDVEGKTRRDGTLKVTVRFTEWTWSAAERFWCINVGLIPLTKKPNWVLDYFRNPEKECIRRINKSRPCLLPISVRREISQMLRERGELSARMLQNIKDRVEKWYHDEGYACAHVVSFGNLNTKELVCEVVEGDITQLVIQFRDKLGNVCKRNTLLPVVRREMNDFREGQIFNMETAQEAIDNLNSLGLFSDIQINPRRDEKNEGGVIVEIILYELEQESAEVNTELTNVLGRRGRPTLVYQSWCCVLLLLAWWFCVQR